MKYSAFCVAEPIELILNWKLRENLKNEELKVKITKYLNQMMVSGLLVAVLILPTTAWSKDISFTEAWHDVLRINDAIAAERTSVERARHIQDAARAMYLPQVDITGSYTRLDKDVEAVPSDLLASMEAGDTVSGMLQQMLGMTAAQMDSSFTTTISQKDVAVSSIRAIWPIFTGGRIDAAQDIVLGQKEEATLLLAMEKQARFEALAKVYFGVELANRIVETRIDVEKMLQRHSRHAALLEKQGQIAKVERLQAETSYDKAHVERRKAQRDLEIAQVALAKMLKVEEVAMVSTKLFTNESLPSLSRFLGKTLVNYPGLGVLDSRKKQASGLVKAEKGKYYPEAFLFGSYSLYEADDLAAELTPDWAVGVKISIPIVDREGRSSKVRAAKSAVTQVGYLRAQAESDLSVLVEKTYREATQALEEYDGLASSLTLAQETVQLREKAFSQGLSTSLDVVAAEMFRAGVQTQRVAAAYNYVLSLARLLAISGEMDSFALYQHQNGIEVDS
jgi:outer membrane protein TolC